MRNMFFTVEATSCMMDDEMTIFTKREIVNTTIYEQARSSFKSLCKRHDLVVYTAYDHDVPGWTSTAVGGTRPHYHEAA